MDEAALAAGIRAGPTFPHVGLPARCRAKVDRVPVCRRYAVYLRRLRWKLSSSYYTGRCCRLVSLSRRCVAPAVTGSRTGRTNSVGWAL